MNRDCTRRNEADKHWAENIKDFQQFPVAGHPDCALTLFAAHNFCPDEGYKGIKKDLTRGFEGNTMFAKV